jgi:hypothetical protein
MFIRTGNRTTTDRLMDAYDAGVELAKRYAAAHGRMMPESKVRYAAVAFYGEGTELARSFADGCRDLVAYGDAVRGADHFAD